MIGRMEMDEPEWRADVLEKLERQRGLTRQDFHSIFIFGLHGTDEHTPELRLYAGYRCVAQNPDEGAWWLELARLHAECGQFAAAEAVLAQLAGLDGMGLYPGVYAEDIGVNLALTRAAAGRFEEALAGLRRASERFGDHPLHLYNLASLLHALERWDEAAESYREALRVFAACAGELGDDVDAEAVQQYISGKLEAAGRREEFAGARPLDLGQLYDA